MSEDFQKELIKVLVKRHTYMELVYMKEKFLKCLADKSIGDFNRESYEDSLNAVEEALKIKNDEMQFGKEKLKNE